MTAPLRHPPSDYIDGTFVPIPGEGVVSRDPAAPQRVLWQGAPQPAHVDAAVDAARRALGPWSNASVDERIDGLRRWRQVTQKHVERLAGLITDEMGKTLAEARQEASALGAKVDITIDRPSLDRVRGFDVEVAASRGGSCRFKPHGVMAVIGPFNFPAHLPNGQFVPALLMGNTVVFKPSEKTPAVGQLVAEMIDEAGLPAGVFNVVQGAGDVAARLSAHADVDGVLFTGSWPVGRKIAEANLDRPGRILALEMGGNNPAVVLGDAHLKQAVIECARAAFATTGQRCTCTRRIIVERSIADRFIPLLCKVASTLVIGPGRSEAPVFMGPVATDQAVEDVLAFQQQLLDANGRILLEAAGAHGDGYFVSPGVIEVDGFSLDRDREVFGPLVQIAVVDGLDEAIAQANATRYGLAASIFTADRSAYEHFWREIRSGCINWNTGTAGASSKLPFGGLGRSGNQRPAGAFAVDFCAYPVAAMTEHDDGAAVPQGMDWRDEWAQAALHGN